MSSLSIIPSAQLAVAESSPMEIDASRVPAIRKQNPWNWPPNQDHPIYYSLLTANLPSNLADASIQTGPLQNGYKMPAEVQTYSQSQQQSSRYSVSQSGSPAIATMPALIQRENPPPSKNETIARSMSRYRGNRHVKTQADAPLIPMDPPYQRQHAGSQSSSDQHNDTASPLGSSRYRSKQKRMPTRNEGNSGHYRVGDTPGHALARSTAASSQARGIPSEPEQKEDVRYLQQKSVPSTRVLSQDLPQNQARPEARSTANKDKIQAQSTHQERSDIGTTEDFIDGDRLQRAFERTHDYQKNPRSFQHGDQSANQPAVKHENLGYLGKEYEQKPKATRPILSPKKSFTQRMAGTISKATASDSRAELKRTISFPIPMDPEDVVSTPTPGFDAPISAVNAGDRRVMVKCQDNVVSVIITPSTTPIDVIRSASSKMPGLVDPNSVVLLESFKQVGLERPLRRYEHIRDVLNSWDNDEQNTLIIVPSPTGGNDNDLDLRNVPREQPGDTSVYLYHSQMPGKWDKRWITLRTDGQVVMAKNLGGEATNICHLSDFDIYVPTPRQMAKKIKPPKKVCFAVKSQQKSSMFMSTANFVHFFSTSDKKLATSWYKAVQEWRSWYLVNIMGEGQKQATNTGNAETANGVHRSTSIKAPFAATRVPKIGSSRQEIPVASAPTIGATAQAQTTHARVRPARDRKSPPVSFPKKLTKDATTGEATTRNHGPSLVQSHPDQAVQAEPFEPASLLGRTYSQRQKALQSSKPPPNHSTTALDPGTDLNRTPSQRHKPKPLVDLTPTYVEPPQHSRKGRGVIPDHLPPGGLIDIATTPDQAIPIPPTSTWRRPREASPATQRTHTLRGPRPSRLDSSPHTSPERSVHADDVAAFTPGGLLAKTAKSQGGTGTGRGIMSGDRQARGPMLDVAEPSQFAQGSLLAVMGEGEGGKERGVVIDREKRRTVDVVVGEGV